MIGYLDAFANYNPLTDTVPDRLIFDVGYIEQQAKLFLPDNFVINDLNMGLEILLQMKKYVPEAVLAFQQNHADQNIQDSLYTSSPFEYFLCTDYVELALRSDGSTYPWSSLFAILALASISNYVALHLPDSASRHIGADNMIADAMTELEEQHVLTLPREAMDALGYARAFHERERTNNSDTRRGQSVRKKKLENYHPLKLAMTKHFNRLPNTMSDRQAAKTIYAGLDDELRYRFSNDSPEQQIQIWLGQYKKGTLPGLEKLPPYQP